MRRELEILERTRIQTGPSYWRVGYLYHMLQLHCICLLILFRAQDTYSIEPYIPHLGTEVHKGTVCLSVMTRPKFRILSCDKTQFRRIRSCPPSDPII